MIGLSDRASWAYAWACWWIVCHYPFDLKHVWALLPRAGTYAFTEGGLRQHAAWNARSGLWALVEPTLGVEFR